MAEFVWTERYINVDYATDGDGTAATEAAGAGLAGAWNNFASAVAGYAAGDRINVKKSVAGRYTLPASTSFAVVTTADVPVWVRGYTDTPGDGGKFLMSQGGFSFGGISHVTLDSIDSVGTSYFGTDNQPSLKLVNCKLDACRPGRRNIVLNCSIINLAARIDEVFLYRGNFISQAPAGAQTSILSLGGSSPSIIGNVIVGNGSCAAIGGGVGAFDSTVIDSNILYNNEYGIELVALPATYTVSVSNNIFYNIAADAVHVVAGATNETSGSAIRLVSNAMGAVTGARLSALNYHAEIDPITLTADPFVDAANGNFNLNEVAGGGLKLRNAVRGMKL